MSSKYVKLTHAAHILQVPDMYIGSIDSQNDLRWVYNSKSNKMEFKNVKLSPGLYKIFDEALVNTLDSHVKYKNVKYIDVSCRMINGVYTINIKNDGDGIPIEYSKEKNDKGESIYTPELIFGHLLTSSNYDKNEEKITGGKNGLGIKLNNLFSSKFTLETVHPDSGKSYSQTWTNNMSICDKPIIKKSSSSKGYVSVTFCPDVKRFIGSFDEAELTSDMENVFHTRVLEIAAMAGKDIKVTYNESEIKVNAFEKFVKLFMSDEKNVAYEKCSDRWEVAVILVKNLFDNDAVLPDEKQISFVNGINTKKGGKHVETVFKNLIGDFCDLAKKKKVDIKPSQLKDSLILFVNATIVNPSFDSQTKETLTTPASKFGSVFKCSSKLPEALVKIGLLEEAQSILEAKAHKDAKKTDGTKKKTLRGMPKLVDALHAGTAKSSECTLILTEGDSAATSAISGLKVVGRELWGVFPLKGKMLNVRDISQDKFAKNEELSAIKKILGLEQKKVYKDTKSLRYGRIMVMADQDLDGSHIKGLLMNLFHAEWPSLMKSGFICSLMTPLLKASKKNVKMSFYTIADFEAWKLKNNIAKGWTIKYYKGLGTSTPEEAQEWFKNLHEIKYQFDKETDENFSLAFSKKRSDDRKKWLGTFDSKRTLNVESDGKVDYSKFINDELIHFSNADNIRSLPSIMDGFKPSQRKILFGCLKRNLKTEVRVAQLAGYVSEHAAYHHGEASLNGAIVSMAQTFVGANNINLLAPVGQFGCLAPDTPILMWDGSIKRADSVIIGDKLIGDDGNVRNVLNITNGVDTMYEIITENNKNYTVNSEHIITLFFNDNNKIKWKHSGKRWYLNYFDGVDIKSINITVNDSISEENHFNKSKLSKDEGYKLILEKQNEIQKQFNCNNVIDIKIENYIKLSNYTKRNLFMISNTNPINWEKKNVPIDPYILGVWLGDGNHEGNGFTSADQEILKEVAIWADTINCEMVHHTNGYEHENYHYGLRRKTSGYRVSIGNKEHSSETCVGCKTSQKESPICNWSFDKSPSFTEYSKTVNGKIRKDMNPFKNLLKANNLFKNKHIPKEYIINDKETRLQLLAGFIDTDGTIKTNNKQQFIEISQSKRIHENLINELEYLANSLGFATTKSERYIGKTKNNLDIITLTLRILGKNIHEIPTKLPRKKLLNTNNSREKKYHNYSKFEINEIGKAAFYGWSVDKNERFLLGNFIVTHNSRLQGGKDSASPRYIHTHLEPIIDTIFRKEDSSILNYLDDDGLLVEPETYYPVLPLLLVNGCIGIGTGFSTDIPPHDPMDIVNLLKDRLYGSRKTLENIALRPWWFGFKGPVMQSSDGVWITKGVYTFNEDKKMVTITELPIGVWTHDYKETLEELCMNNDKETNKPLLKNYEDLYNHVDIRFDLYLDPDYFYEAQDNIIDFEKKFHLTSTWRTSNMVAFDTNMSIKKYECAGDLIEEFYSSRINKYEERRVKEINQLKQNAIEADAKARFLRGVLNDTIDLRRKSDEEIVAIMKTHDLPPISGVKDVENIDSYDYLLRLRIDRVKASAIVDAENAVMKAKEMLEALEKTNATELWLNDLDAFITSWNSMKSDREELLSNNVKVKTKTKK